jgi:hypothetical protein
MRYPMLPSTQSGITLLRVCRSCRCEPVFVMDLVRAGVLEPQGQRPIRWRFTPPQQRRAEMATYLSRRYDLNTEALTFMMKLMDMNQALRERLAAVSGYPGDAYSGRTRYM